MDQRQNPDIRTGDGVTTQRLELSVPQVAGSALAAIAAAVFASKLGVYGTIIGAGVVSVIATCGGTVFQHLFRRTGDQIREVSVQVKPKARQVYDSEPAPAPTPAAPQVPADPSPQEAAADDEFGGATTYGTRVRGWKRPVVAAAAVFAVAMLAITGYELAAGQDLSGGKGTTFSSVVRGGDTGGDSTPGGPAGPQDGGPTPSDDSTDTDKGTGTVESPPPSAPGTGQSPDPNASENGGPSTAPTPEPSRPEGGSGDSSGEGVSPPPHESTVPSPPPSPTPSP
ncbi:hypothetical protein [Streptomyces sp. NPDC060366]|uniref:hypothetical protein n=1 Tax=Streptomyces sp. NPDC060366 TaxID=3347105 RepID=UPI0036505CC4